MYMDMYMYTAHCRVGIDMQCVRCGAVGTCDRARVRVPRHASTRLARLAPVSRCAVVLCVRSAVTSEYGSPNG